MTMKTTPLFLGLAAVTLLSSCAAGVADRAENRYDKARGRRMY